MPVDYDQLLFQTLRDSVSVVAASGISTDSQVVVATAGLRIMGYSCKEVAATSTPANFNIIHGTTTTDPVLVYGKLSTGAGGGPSSITDWFGPRGVICPNGIFVDVISGAVNVSVYTTSGAA